QSLIIGAAALMLYRTAEKKLSDSSIALQVMIAFLLFPFLPAIALSNFHADPFVLFPFFAAWYFHISGKNRLFWVFITLSLLVKEYMVLPVGLLGLYLAGTDRKKGLILIGLAALYYLIIVPIIIHLCIDIPIAIKTQSHALTIPKSSDYTSIINALNKIISTAFKPSNIICLLIVTILFGYQLYRNKRGLIMVLPMITLLYTLNQIGVFRTHRHTIIIPALFIVYIDALAKMEPGAARKRFTIAITAASSLFFFFSSESVIGLNIKERFIKTEYRNFYHYSYTEHDRLTDSVIQMVPSNARVSSEDGIRTKLCKREWSYLLPFPRNLNDADVYIYDFFEALAYIPWEKKTERVGTLLKSPEFDLICNLDGIIFFKRIDSIKAEPAAAFDTLSLEKFPGTNLNIVSKKIDRISSNRYRMTTILCKGDKYSAGDALISFLVYEGDTARILHTSSFCLTSLKDLPTGMYREEFIFNVPEGFNAERASHTTNLYQRDKYLSFFDRDKFLIKSEL
ncbi:MAG: DUF2079 domain-containing protein, partial [Fibrobacteres bacterium]|nr:DUF2079 domain-containing protein [Fibrobacterota bacterium]